MSPARHLIWTLVATIGGLALAGCDFVASKEPRTNILIIVSDTLRGDDIDCDDDTVATPNVCALAARGVQFTRAYSHAPGTLRSSVAMFTGNHTSSYQASEEMADGNAVFHVPASQQLLAESLADEGYDTPAFLQNKLAAAGNAMQGFRKLGRDYVLGLDVAGLEERLDVDLSLPTSRALAGSMHHLLEATGNFFLVQWIVDPHAVYRPPSRFLKDIDVDHERLSRPIKYYMGLGHFKRARRKLRKLEEELPALSEYERSFLRRLYQKEIESVDERVGFVLEALARSGREDNTVVVFTSDHGEAFGEHGLYLHGRSLYDEMVRVPLILAGPGVPEGRRVSRRVSTVDLTPTLADLVDCDCLEETRGASLVPAMTGQGREGAAVYLANPGRQPADALIEGRYKLIANTSTGMLELYDLDADPLERTNLATELPDVVSRMHRRLRDIRAGDELRREAVLLDADEAALERTRRVTRRDLEAIGYLD